MRRRALLFSALIMVGYSNWSIQGLGQGRRDAAVPAGTTSDSPGRRGTDVVPGSGSESPSRPGIDVVPGPGSDDSSLQPTQSIGDLIGSIGDLMGPTDQALTSMGVMAAQGSFRATCRDIRLEGSLLRAVCKNRDVVGIDTGWSEASLETSECFSVDQISNEDGRLDCSPAGSYRQSCRNRVTYRSQNAMTADCLESEPLSVEPGPRRAARLESVSTCRQDTIENLDGILACTRRPF